MFSCPTNCPGLTRHVLNQRTLPGPYCSGQLRMTQHPPIVQYLEPPIVGPVRQECLLRAWHQAIALLVFVQEVNCNQRVEQCARASQVPALVVGEAFRRAMTRGDSCPNLEFKTGVEHCRCQASPDDRIPECFARGCSVRRCGIRVHRNSPSIFSARVLDYPATRLRQLPHLFESPLSVSWSAQASRKAGKELTAGVWIVLQSLSDRYPPTTAANQARLHRHTSARRSWSWSPRPSSCRRVSIGRGSLTREVRRSWMISSHSKCWSGRLCTL